MSSSSSSMSSSSYSLTLFLKKWGEGPQADYHNVTQDTFLDASIPTSIRGLNSEMYANAYQRTSKSLIKFDLNNIELIISSVNDISSAKLYLYVDQNSASTGSVRLHVRRIKKAWSDARTTWNKANKTTPWQFPGALGSSDRTDEFKTIVVQEDQTGWVDVGVLDWVRWSYINDQYYGFLIEVQQISPSLGTVAFSTSENKSKTRRPYLEVGFLD
jgi:hypothetical protein